MTDPLEQERVMNPETDKKIEPMPYLELAEKYLALEAKLSKMEDDYHELLLAVVNKHEGETRHETALRYITEHENRPATESLAGGDDELV